MEIGKNSVVTLKYQMFDIGGELLDDGAEPLVYLHGGYDNIFPTVEEALQGKQLGDSVDLNLTPEYAFGEYDESLIRMEPAHLFPKDIHVGMMFEADEEDEGVALFTITDIADGKVVLDGNHPLAGRTLHFIGTVAEIRAATADEVTHGHVHGEHGHQH